MISLKYDNTYEFTEGLGPVSFNDKYGYIDKTGKIVIPLKFIDGENFDHGKAYVQIKGEKGSIGDRNASEWIYIDKTGKKIN